MSIKNTFKFLPGPVFVIGGSGGIGKEICLHFAANNVPVIFTYHNNKDSADKLIAEISLSGSSAEAIQLSPGSVYVLRFASYFLGGITRTNLHDWEPNIHTSMRGKWRCFHDSLYARRRCISWCMRSSRGDECPMFWCRCFHDLL